MTTSPESKWTKGPWQFVPWHIAEGPSEVRAPEGWLICTTSGDANARLIASAPDLYEALRNCSVALNYCLSLLPQDDPLRTKVMVTKSAALDVIAKAEGRS